MCVFHVCGSLERQITFLFVSFLLLNTISASVCPGTRKLLMTAPRACLETINRQKCPPPPQCHYFVSIRKVFKQQYTSCMKVGTGVNLDLSREYHKKHFEPLFYPWWNCHLNCLRTRHCNYYTDSRACRSRKIMI